VEYEPEMRYFFGLRAFLGIFWSVPRVQGSVVRLSAVGDI
jgi:hypothetical protein